MILREVRLLRTNLEIYTASVREPDRPSSELSEEERDESGRTFYVKRAGAFGMWKALGLTALKAPVHFSRGLWYAISLAGLRPKQLLLNLAYFGEAAMVGTWMWNNGLNHLHTHYSSTVALLVYKTFGVDISISFHGSGEFIDPGGFWVRQKVAACTFVRAISQYARSELMKSSAAADWSKIRVVYLGVDPDDFPPRPFRPNPTPLEILCAGRLSPEKALHLLMEAMDGLVRQKLDVLLHLAGDGPERQRLEEEVSARGLAARVTFHGFLSQDRLKALYRQADLFALSSLAEGVPAVLMEAMAMEIPCVATSITGIPELIRDGVEGLLVPPGDPEALAGALRRLITDADLRLRLGQAGRRRVLDQFDLRKNSATLARLFAPLDTPAN